jgi:thioredoxin-like negative regulator of GroEL
VHGLEAEYSGKVDFAYLDIDDPRTNPFKQQLGYSYQPHIFLLDSEGNVVQQWVGPVSKADLVAALDQIAN